MSDAPPASSWCTNWGSFNTPRLWAMVAEEDDPDAWRQVAAWGDVATAVKDHRSRLEAAKQSLIAAWPPSTNASADAFVNELDRLLTRMDTARQDADTTATGLSHILDALRNAKQDIQPLYDEYRSKNNDIVPGWFDNAEDEIDEKARQHMIKAEQIVQQHVPQIKVPDEYKMDPTARSGYSREQTTTGGGSYSGGPGSTGGSGGSGGSGSGSSGGGFDAGPGVGSGVGPGGGSEITVPHDPPPPMPGMDPIVPDDVGSGAGPGGPGGGGPGGGREDIDLAGVITPVPPAPAPPIAPVPPPGLQPIPGPGPGPVPLPPTPILPSTVPTGLPGGGGGGNRPPVRVGGVRGALPSGAVIGETVGGGARGGASIGNVSGRPGNVSAGNAGAGGRGGTAKPIRPSWLPVDEHGSGSGRNASSQHVGSSTGRRVGEREEEGGEGRRFDPDNPWEVSQGVAPVINPQPHTTRNDPGPNVIGGFRG